MSSLVTAFNGISKSIGGVNVGKVRNLSGALNDVSKATQNLSKQSLNFSGIEREADKLHKSLQRILQNAFDNVKVNDEGVRAQIQGLIGEMETLAKTDALSIDTSKQESAWNRIMEITVQVSDLFGKFGVESRSALEMVDEEALRLRDHILSIGNSVGIAFDMDEMAGKGIEDLKLFGRKSSYSKDTRSGKMGWDVVLQEMRESSGFGYLPENTQEAFDYVLGELRAIKNAEDDVATSVSKSGN
jgi:hypothetical protein